MSRYVYETHIMKDPMLPFIYHYDCVGQNTGAISNWHENIEILTFVKGKGRVKIGELWYEVNPGDIAVIDPQVLHTVVGEDYVEYHCMIIDKSFCDENGINIMNLSFKCIIEDEVVYKCIENFVCEITALRNSASDLCSVAAVRCTALAVLIKLCRYYGKDISENRESVSASSELTKDVIKYLREHMSESISLDMICEKVGASKYHMSREFKKMAGITIFDYINVLRCKEARRMLQEGASVSEAAFATGFENLSYFSRCFKRHIGNLPSFYTRKRK